MGARGLSALAVGALACLLAACGGTQERDAARPAAITLTADSGHRVVAACSGRVSVAYRVGDRVRYAGTLPKGSEGPVTVLVRRCQDGRFVTVRRLTEPLDAGAVFRGSFAADEPSEFYLQASFDGAEQTAPQHFSVLAREASASADAGVATAAGAGTATAAPRGQARGGRLGVLAVALTPGVVDEAAARGQPAHTDRGLLIQRVEHGGPAETAGLRGPVVRMGVGLGFGGDVVQSIDGEEVRSGSDLARAVKLHAPGEIIRVGIVRRGKPMTVEVRAG